MEAVGLYLVIILGLLFAMPGSSLHAIGAKVAFLPTLLYNLLRSRIDRNWYDRIDHTVVLGALPFRSTAEKLVADNNVRGIISLNQEYELKYFSPSTEEWSNLGATQLRIPTLDFDAAPSVEDIQKGINFIRFYKDRNESVYVHCKAGRGRSALLVVCYLIKEKCMHPEEAFQFVKSKRSHVLLWANQRQRVEEFASSLDREDADHTE